MQDILRTQRENIFTQAAFGKDVREMAMKVMDIYEDGELKDQKLNRKHLLAVPEFKQHLLQPLHHLPAAFQLEVLQQVQERVISLQEMKLLASEFRSLELIRKCFIRITSVNSWEEACIRFPNFTVEERIKQFQSLDFKHEPPEVFRNYCDAALASKSAQPGVCIQADSGSCICLVCSTFFSLTAQSILDVDSSFAGAHLIAATMPDVCYHIKCTIGSI